MEVHALHQVSQRLGLEGGQSGVTDSPVTQKQTDVSRNDGAALVCATLPDMSACGYSVFFMLDVQTYV